MRLGEIKQVTTRPAAFTPRDAASESPGQQPRGQAIVAVAPAAEPQDAPSIYRQAAFLAHLLAMRGQHPQTRERRRAEPGVAIAAYRSTAALVP